MVNQSPFGGRSIAIAQPRALVRAKSGVWGLLQSNWCWWWWWLCEQEEEDGRGWDERE